METYEQRQLRIEEENMDDWIGVKMDMRDVSREELLARVRKIMGPPKPEPHITTDIHHPEGVPEFILELEKDVYTAIN